MEFFAQIIINSIAAGAIYALFAIGFSLIYKTTKFFNLAYGTITLVGGYITLLCYKTFSINIFLAALLGALFTGVVGYFSDKLIFKKLRANGSSNTVLLIASLGLATVIQSLLAIFFTNQFQTLSSNTGTYTTYTLFGGIITQTQILILISLLFVFVFVVFLKRSFLGKKIEAISDSEEVSKIIGINTDKIIGNTFFIGSVIGGLACILIGMDTGINPNMGTDFLLKGVTASIIGGVGNLYGGVTGGLLIGLIENFSVWQFSGEWKDAITFIILILFLLFRPNGIFKK